MELSTFKVFAIMVFSVWFLMSILYQVNWISSWIGRYDYLSLLPKWTFFAPNPGTYDHHIIYRECGANVDTSSPDKWLNLSSRLSPWQELSYADLESGIPFLWNPKRRMTKAISDIANSFAAASLRHSAFSQYMPFTLEYFLITHLVQQKATPNTQFQWAIVRSHGFSENRQSHPFLVSKFHLSNVT